MSDTEIVVDGLDDLAVQNESGTQIDRSGGAHAAPTSRRERRELGLLTLPERAREPGHETAWAREPAWTLRKPLEPTEFPRTPWGHRGYEEPAVDAFVNQVVKDIEAADQQIMDLRAEVDRLHRYIRRQWSAVAVAESAERPQNDASPRSDQENSALVTPAAQARAVLTQAQEIAERRLVQADARLAEVEAEAAELLAETQRQVQVKLADADREATRLIAEGDGAAARQLNRMDAIAERMLVDARDDAQRRRTQAQGDSDRLLLLARTRYQDIVVRAHQRADRAAEVALGEFQGPSPTSDDLDRTRVELEMKTAYLRTFAKVSRGALQAALDVTAREFDHLLGATAAQEAGPEPGRDAAIGTDDGGSGAVTSRLDEAEASPVTAESSAVPESDVTPEPPPALNETLVLDGPVFRDETPGPVEAGPDSAPIPSVEPLRPELVLGDGPQTPEQRAGLESRVALRAALRSARLSSVAIDPALVLDPVIASPRSEPRVIVLPGSERPTVIRMR